jgi:hypothetical protein
MSDDFLKSLGIQRRSLQELMGVAMKNNGELFLKASQSCDKGSTHLIHAQILNILSSQHKDSKIEVFVQKCYQLMPWLPHFQCL